MDPYISKDLEFDKVLELVAAHARTGVGRRFTVGLVAPIVSAAEGRRLARFTRAVENLLEEDGPIAFAGVDEAAPWLEPGSPLPSEPRDLADCLNLARRVAAIRSRLGDADNSELEALADRLPDTSGLVAAAGPRLGRDGSIADNASPELTRLRREMSRARTEVVAELEAIRRSHPGTVTDAPPTLRRDRYCIPVHASSRSQLPGLLLDNSASGATSFVEPFAVVELNNRLAAAVAGEREEIRRIVQEIAGLVADARDELAAAVEVLAGLDSAQARALFGRAVEGRVVMPGEGPELVLRGARHPLLDERLHLLRREVFGAAERRDPEHRVVPLDFHLAEGVRTLVVSGPNAGGKTVVLKTLALMVLMCARGIPLPVEYGTSIPEFTKLWCHIGDEQDVSADLSTFSGAMAATARLLEEADADTLVLFDELGAGTDPLEGAALGCALLEELGRRSALTVASTHLAAIALAASSAEGMNNAAMEYDEASENPTYQLRMGRPGRSRGLEIAHRMGVGPSVLDRARELLGGNHLEIDRWLRKLEALEQELEAEQVELARRQADAERLRRQYLSELEQLREAQAEVPKKLAAERDELRRRAKKKLDVAISELEAAKREQRALGRRRLQKLRDEALRLEQPSARKDGDEPDGLAAGARVRLALGGGQGVLEELRGSQARVAVGGKYLWVPVGELEVVQGPAKKRRAEVRVEAAEEVPRELNLIGLDSERAGADLERFLDQALTAGARTVRIVHGHGAGILRAMVAEVCRSHPAVKSFRHPSRQFGGTGATEIEIDLGD